MRALRTAWDATRHGALLALETPLTVVAVGAAAVLQLVYERQRPDSLPAAADWLFSAALMALFLAFVLRAVRGPALSFPRALGAFLVAQAASAAALTAVFLFARAGFLAALAPVIPASFCALAAFGALGGVKAAKSRWRESLILGAFYAVAALAFSQLMRLLPGGAAALPATAFFAFMGLFAAAAPAALEGE